MVYIDADKVINELMEKQSDDIREQIGIYEAVVMLYRALAAETADVAEVKHGEWIGNIDFPIMQAIIRCSLCNEPSITMSKYCPNCGAKMDGGSE